MMVNNLRIGNKIAFIQFYASLNEGLFRGLLIVFMAFSALEATHSTASHISRINLINLIYVLPLIFLSSYAGKICDANNKIKVIRWVTVYQLVLALGVVFAVYCHSRLGYVLILFAIGVEFAFFHAVKFSVVPQILDKQSTVLTTSRIHFSSFLALTVGQVISSVLFTHHQAHLVVVLIVLCGIGSVITSYSLNPLLSQSFTHSINSFKFYFNPVHDVFALLKVVKADRTVWVLVNLIAWFWTFIALNNVQLPLFIQHYLGGSGDILGLVIAIDSVGIVIGVILCTKFAKGNINNNIITVGMALVSGIVLLMLLLYMNGTTIQYTPLQFVSSSVGITFILLMFVKSIATGGYSITCYHRIQVLTSDVIRSQVMASTTVLSSLYIVISTLTILLTAKVMTVWGVFFGIAIINLLIAYLYHRSSKVNC